MPISIFTQIHAIGITRFHFLNYKVLSMDTYFVVTRNQYTTRKSLGKKTAQLSH